MRRVDCLRGFHMAGEWEQRVAPDDETVGEGQRLDAESLPAFFERVTRFALALSGGVDSAYVLAAARNAGCAVKAYLVDTAFQPAFELEDARAVAAAFDVPLEVIEVDVLSRSDICANSPDRCRLCKRLVFSEIKKAARRDGFAVVVDGTNATDDPARRPGFISLAEAGVASPLRRAGLSKAEVREGARALGVSVADKPRFACLAVHVPAGERICAASLAEAARACGVVYG